jgi:hypothetical protein
MFRYSPPLLAVAFLCCGGADTQPAAWQVVVENDAALLSVSGTATDDIWMVGADTGEGPLVLHWDGAVWARERTGVSGDLWWVQALPSGSVYMGGSGGMVLEYHGGAVERMSSPELADHIVFGVWAAADDDLYAVGSAVEGTDGNGFLWHYDGETWDDVPLPAALLAPDGRIPALFKVWGASASDVWVVGDQGIVLRGNASEGFRRIGSGSADRLFTVHGANGRVAMVGGSANGWALEADGDKLAAITPPGSAPLQGVCVAEGGAVWAVGVGGSIYVREAGAQRWRDVLTHIPVQSLHAVWVDPQGGVWAVGGNVLTSKLDHGVALHSAE